MENFDIEKFRKDFIVFYSKLQEVAEQIREKLYPFCYDFHIDFDEYVLDHSQKISITFEEDRCDYDETYVVYLPDDIIKEVVLEEYFEKNKDIIEKAQEKQKVMEEAKKERKRKDEVRKKRKRRKRTFKKIKRKV
jgi:hypothetical protein